jgi:AraC-like DNA-binding protein
LTISFRALEPAIHPVYARLLCAQLQRRGFTPEVILQGLPFDWKNLHHSNQFLSFDEMRRLIEQALQLSGCPWLGLEVGLNTQASAHGTLGMAMIASNNLFEAVALLQRYSSLRQHLATLELQHQPQLAVCLHEWVPLGSTREYLMGQLLGGLFQLFNTLTGRDIRAFLCIEWPFNEPPWAEQYLRVASSNSFGHKQLRVLIQSDVLHSPSMAADEHALANLLRECDAQLKRAEHGGLLADQVRLRLLRCEHTMPTLPELANALNVSERTFIRRLKAENTSYQELLDEVRTDRACWLLEQTSHTVEEVAHLLGYEDASNFSRTFKRWLGCTPSAHRLAARPRPA